jgi:hypothetical protein
MLAGRQRRVSARADRRSGDGQVRDLPLAEARAPCVPVDRPGVPQKRGASDRWRDKRLTLIDAIAALKALEPK